MNLLSFFRVCWLFTGVFSAPLLAANADDLHARLQAHSGEVRQLQQEYEFVQIKSRATAEKLRQAEQELASKQAQIVQMRAAAGESPTAEAQAIIDNEAQRIALAELAIKSRSAALNRLQRKEEELRLALAASQQAIATAEQHLAATRARNAAEAQAKTRAMQEQLQALQAENEQLRVAMEDEARRAQRAAAEAARLAEEARRQEEALAATSAATQQAAAVQTLADNTGEADLSQVVLEGEPPIYRDDDTLTITMRSRSIDTPVVMTAVGPNRYRAEVAVEPGRAFFDVRSRRYRGHFPEGEDATYVFYYDLGAEKPVLSVLKKSTADQMVSNTKDPF